MTDDKQLALAPNNDPICTMLETLVKGGVTNDSVGALERLVGLYERNQARQAEQEFARAFADLQRELPKIQATKPVPNRDGTERYRFAPFEEIMRQAQPFLSAHGFSVSFNTRWDGPRIIVACKLLHSSGHSQTNEFAARVGDGPPGANAGQADMAIKTLAKRGALCDALNIVVERDTDGDDARLEGTTIGPGQTKEIQDLVAETQANLADLLKFAGAASIAEIRTDKYEEIVSLLERKRRKKAPVTDPKETDPDLPY